MSTVPKGREPAPIARVVSATLTGDIDKVHNVDLYVDGAVVTIACLDAGHAERLARELNAAAWVELDS